MSGSGAGLAFTIGRSIAGLPARMTAAMTGLAGAATGQTVAAIGGTIGRMDEIANTIASAIHEQDKATEEISGSVQLAAQGTVEITKNIAGVNNTASDTGAAAAQVLSSSTELSQQAERLRGEVGDFLANIRAA